MGQVVSAIVPVALDVLGTSAKDKAQSRQAELDKQEIEQQRKADEVARKRALRVSVAQQRARFGASGVDAVDGSGEAVLLGLFEQTQEELDARAERDRLRSRAVDIGRDYSRTRNLLDVTDTIRKANFDTTFTS